MHKFRKIFFGAGMLAICSVVAKLLGAFFRIPLTNILGAEGMGIYQMVFPIYSVVLTLACGGIPVAVSKVVASHMANESHRFLDTTNVENYDANFANTCLLDHNNIQAKRALKVGLIAMAVVGALATALILVLHRVIATIQGNPVASIAYLGIAPSVFFVCVVSVFRGYFQGKQNMLPTSIMQIVEQLFKLVFGIGLAMHFLQYGMEYAVLGAIIGISISECVAMLVMLGCYTVELWRHKHTAKEQKSINNIALDVATINKLELAPINNLESSEDNNLDISKDNNLEISNYNKLDLVSDKNLENYKDNNLEVALDWNLTDFEVPSKSYDTQSNSENIPHPSVLKAIYKIAIPVTLGALIFPLTQVLDSIIIINFLKHSGLSNSLATAQYGILNGPVSSLINLPVLITMAISIALLPKIAKEHAKNKTTQSKVHLDDNATLSYSISSIDTQSQSLSYTVNNAMRYSLLIAIPAFIGMTVFGRDIISFMYGRGLKADELAQSTQILKLTVSIVLYASIMQVCTATMQGLDKASIPAVILLVSALIKVICTFVGLYLWGIYGASIAGIIFYIVACTLNVLWCKKHVDMRYSAKTGFKILFATAIAFSVGFGVYQILARDGFIALAICGTTTLAVLVPLLWKLGCFKSILNS